jgi:hypothetical protein
MRRSLSCAFALVAAAGACQSDGTVAGNPNPDVLSKGLGDGPAGVYVLRSVAGQSLPSVIVSHEYYHALMVADTIFLNEGGMGGASEVKRVTEDPRNGEHIRTEQVTFAYEVTGNRLTAEIPCPPLASCLVAPHYAGTLSFTALDLDLALNYRVPLHYEKVAGPTSVAAVRISPSPVTIRAGQTLQLSAVALDAQGRNLNRRIAWTAVSPSVVSMPATGKIFGITEGDGAVAAFVDGRSDTVFVRVNK